MFNFIAIFVFIGSVLGQDSQTDATCNPQPIVNYNFGTDGVFGLKGQKVFFRMLKVFFYHQLV